MPARTYQMSVRAYLPWTSFCLGLLIVPALWAQENSTKGIISVHPDQQFQVIQGFGMNFTGPYFRDDQKAMFNQFIDDLGVTMFRVVPYYVYTDWETTSEKKDWEYWNNRYSTPVFEATWNAIHYLNSRGIRPVIQLMGPVPGWMTDEDVSSPQHKVCRENLPASQQNHLSPSKYDAFAEEVVTMLEYARTKEHVDFGYFSPFNETDCYPTEGPRIDPDEVPKVLKVVAQKLDQEGLGDVRLEVPDNAVITNDYTDPILKDRKLMNQVGAFAFHSYGENSVGPQVARVSGSAYQNIPVWLTEYGDLSDQDRTFENQWKSFCLASNRRALIALNQGASAIYYFDAFDDYEECMKRLCYYGLFSSASHVYSKKKSYFATRQLYHFVRPGWRRVSVTTSTPGLTVSAFRGPTKDSVVIVGVKEGGPAFFTIELPRTTSGPSSWDLYETTRELDCQKVSAVLVRDGTAVIELPDEAVFTLVGRSSSENGNRHN